MPDMDLIGKRLKALRVSNGIKQEVAAYEMGISQSTISAQECGTNQPSISSLIWYAQKYNVSVDYILGLIDVPCPLIREEKAAPQEAEQPKPKRVTAGFSDKVQEIVTTSPEFQKAIADLVRKEVQAALRES